MLGFTSFLVVGMFSPSIIVGQDFPSHTLAYQVINGKVFFETTTTPAPSIIETIFPFLGNSYESVNSPEVDAAILNSISGPPQPEPELGPNSYEQPAPGGYNSYDQPPLGGNNPNEQTAPGGFHPYGHPSSAYNPIQAPPPLSGYNPLNAPPSLSDFNAHQKPAYGSPESPYLSNEEDHDNYLGSASVNVPYQSVPISGSLPASPSVSYQGYPSPNYIPFDGPYDPSSIPQKPQYPQQYPSEAQQQYPSQPQQQYPSQPPQKYPSQLPQQYPSQQYPAQPPQQYPPQYHQQYYPNSNSYFPTPQPESSPPFYQPILDFFGFGSRSDPPPSPAPFPYFSQQVVQARNAEVQSNYQDAIEVADAVPELIAEASMVPRSLEAAPLALPRSDSDPSDDFPCPKLGTWTWDGKLCIAVGPVPVWACAPNDLVMSGRIAVCRNKVFL